MTAHTSTLHVRVDNDVKEQATRARSDMGLSMSDAVRLFLRCVVVDQAFLLKPEVLNVQTRVAMEKSRAMMAIGRARFATSNALFANLEKNSGQ